MVPIKFIDWLKKWKLDSLKINAKFLEVTLKFTDKDKIAAWDMYIELITRSTTQFLIPDQGDEKRALESIWEVFTLSREVIKRNGPECINFAKIAIIVLNQVIRPFTTKWHKLALEGAFLENKKCKDFRKELQDLQLYLRKYTQMLAAMAEVEDITDIEKT